MGLRFATDRDTRSFIIIFDGTLPTAGVAISIRDRQTGKFLSAGGWSTSQAFVPLQRIVDGLQAHLSPDISQALFNAPFLQIDVPALGISERFDCPAAPKVRAAEAPPPPIPAPEVPEQPTERGTPESPVPLPSTPLPAKPRWWITAMASLGLFTLGAVGGFGVSSSQFNAVVQEKDVIIQAVQKELQARNSDVDASSKEGASLIAQNAALRAENAKLKGDISTARNELEEKKKNIDKKEAYISELNTRANAVRNNSNTKSDALEKWEAELKAREAIVDENESIIAHREQKVRERENAVSQKEQCAPTPTSIPAVPSTPAREVLLLAVGTSPGGGVSTVVLKGTDTEAFKREVLDQCRSPDRTLRCRIEKTLTRGCLYAATGKNIYTGRVSWFSDESAEALIARCASNNSFCRMPPSGGCIR